ncbi:MAG: DnaJ domain-containing protein [Paludibacteraceae bacterium]|nr:DnaJ domain-containing protein [Paludibacteraceae bacterium]
MRKFIVNAFLLFVIVLTGCSETKTFECRYVSGTVQNGEYRKASITIGEEVERTDEREHYACPIFPYSKRGNACIKCAGYDNVYMSVSELLAHPDVKPIKLSRETRSGNYGEPMWLAYGRVSAELDSATVFRNKNNQFIDSFEVSLAEDSDVKTVFNDVLPGGQILKNSIKFNHEDYCAGLAKLRAYDKRGGKVSLGKGSSITLSFDASESFYPKNVWFWWYDEELGCWVAEKRVSKENGKYTAKVDKLGWWCAYAFRPSRNLLGEDADFKAFTSTLTDYAGVPVPYAILTVSNGGQVLGTCRTDKNGRFLFYSYVDVDVTFEGFHECEPTPYYPFVKDVFHPYSFPIKRKGVAFQKETKLTNFGVGKDKTHLTDSEFIKKESSLSRNRSSRPYELDHIFGEEPSITWWSFQLEYSEHSGKKRKSVFGGLGGISDIDASKPIKLIVATEKGFQLNIKRVTDAYGREAMIDLYNDYINPRALLTGELTVEFFGADSVFNRTFYFFSFSESKFIKPKAEDDGNGWVVVLLCVLSLVAVVKKWWHEFYLGEGKYSTAEAQVRLIACVLQLHLVLTIRQKQLIVQYADKLGIYDIVPLVEVAVKGDNSISDGDYQELNKQFSLSERRELVHLLFKLAAEDDGIKNDEWHLILQIMSNLKLNKANVVYMQRRYSPLRSESDDYSSDYSTSGDKGSGSTDSGADSAKNSAYASDYAELGLTTCATKEDVQQAYHKLAMEYHPDLPKNASRHNECVRKMAAVNVAYKRLTQHL